MSGSGAARDSRPGSRKRGAKKKAANRSAEILEAERGQGRIAGLIALASVFCWLGALILANANGGGPGPSGSSISGAGGVGGAGHINQRTELLSFHKGISDQGFATVLRCLGLVLTAAAAVYMFRFVRARTAAVPGYMLWLAFVAVALVGGATVFGFFSLRDVADTFVQQPGPLRTTARGKQLLDNAGSIKAASILDLGSRIVLAAWIAAASLQMMRVVLLDRFMAYWGFAAAGALVVLPIGDAMFIAWLGSIGIMALGWWPGGRPEGWRKLSTVA